MERTPKAIGKDVCKVIAFRFGMYRYQVEHFDHNVKREDPPTPTLLVPMDNPMKRGTKIYRFIDHPEWNRQVAVTILFDEFLEEEDVRKGVLDDTLRPHGRHYYRYYRFPLPGGGG